MAGQLISEKYPSGRRVAYTVDEAGRLANVFGGGRTYLSNLSYAGHGGLTSMTYGNGATESFSYNDRLQLTQQSLVKNSSVIQQYDYGYGVVNLNDGSVDTSKNTGQLARVDAFIGGSVSSPTKQWQQRFSYDSIGRLEKAKEVRGDNSSLVWESKFSYDRWGNRYRKASENPNSLSFVAVEETDVDKATNRIATNTTYDEAGNTTTDTKFRNKNYRYDANGRMVWTQATSGGNDSTAIYDALGQRIATKVNNQWRYSVYDVGGKMVAEYGQASSSTSKIQYLMMDRQGSTRVVMNQGGSALTRFDYQPFGEDISAGIGQRTTSQGYGGSDSSRQRYALTERDEATGLDHTWWRKYENTAGRWTSPDPYKGGMDIGDPQSFNRFAYVTNDPVNFVDPSGLCSWQAPYTTNPNGTITIGPITWLTPCNVSSSGGSGGGWVDTLAAAGFGRASKRAITEGEPRGASPGVHGNDSGLDRGCFAACMGDVGLNTFLEAYPSTSPLKAVYDLSGIELNVVQAIAGYEQFGPDASASDIASGIANLNNSVAQGAGARAEGEIGRAEDLMSRRGATTKQINKQKGRIKNLKRVTSYAKRSLWTAIAAIALDKGIDTYECYSKCQK